jgi:eukaryotic-like serine/threonine-protein kinase
MRVPPPVPPRSGRAREARYPPPAARSNRDDLGCATWLIGSAILLGIVGLIVVAFRIGPDVFSASPAMTSTPSAAVVEPTASMTPTVAPDEPTPTPLPAPTETPAPEPTPTVEPSPTATVEPTPTVVIAAVPGLVNITRMQAEEAVGTRWNLVVQEEFNQAAAGTVVSQSPAAGTLLPDGEVITIVVSRGPEFTSIPDVRGLPRATGVSRLESLGFGVTVVEEPSAQFAAGQITRTDPVTSARTGSTVTVYVSQEGVAIMPYVYRWDVNDAIDEIEAAGLTVGSVVGLSCSRIRQETPGFNCDTFPDGGIVFSTIAWEDAVPEGTRVDLAFYDKDP